MGVFIVRLGKVIFLELLGSLFRKKRMELELQIRISSSSISVASEEGMNEKLLRSPSNRCHPKSIHGSVLPTVALACSKKPPGISVFGKKGRCC